MKLLHIAMAGLVLGGTASAHMPIFEASCGRGLEVRGDVGGPVYINGKPAPLMRVADDAFRANAPDVTIVLSVSEHETPKRVLASWKSGDSSPCLMKVEDHAHNDAEEDIQLSSGTGAAPVPAPTPINAAK